MGDSMARCVLQHFIRKAEDTEILEVLEYALHLCNRHLETVSDLFRSEAIPIPHGFGEEDVDLQAGRLFSDTFYLMYLKNVSKQGLALYAVALATIARADVRSYFTECLASASELYNRVAALMLHKGLFVRAPNIPNPESVEYVHKEGFLNGLFGDRRPLNAMEISHLYSNIQTNAMGKATIMGFAQSARSDEVKRYFLRGKEIAAKQIEVFSSYLQDDDLPAPMTWDSEVLASKEAPFSDKLMLFHISGLTAAGLVNYGTALSVSMRRDLAVDYLRLIGEIGTYADDGVELMVKKGWMEKPPGAVDRNKLAFQTR